MRHFTRMNTGSYRGRFAPSPTGPLHPGSLVAALGSWLFARRAGGDWLLRMEDIDPPREVPGAAALQIATLNALGLAPDRPVLYQSQRSAAYSEALQHLLHSGRAFACRCSRSDLEATAGKHLGPCVNTDPLRPTAIRLRVPDTPIVFEDAVQGRIEQDLRREVGDVVLRRSDGLWAYQLAVVVDDAAQGITEVVRGADLLDSTPRQIWLQRCLGLPTPRYVHLPLVTDAAGRKLSKSQNDRPIDLQHAVSALDFAWRHLRQPELPVPSGTSPQQWLKRATDSFDPARITAGQHGEPQ